MIFWPSWTTFSTTWPVIIVRLAGLSAKNAVAAVTRLRFEILNCITSSPMGLPLLTSRACGYPSWYALSRYVPKAGSQRSGKPMSTCLFLFSTNIREQDWEIGQYQWDFETLFPRWTYFPYSAEDWATFFWALWSRQKLIAVVPASPLPLLWSISRTSRFSCGTVWWMRRFQSSSTKGECQAFQGHVVCYCQRWLACYPKGLDARTLISLSVQRFRFFILNDNELPMDIIHLHQSCTSSAVSIAVACACSK